MFPGHTHWTPAHACTDSAVPAPSASSPFLQTTAWHRGLCFKVTSAERLALAALPKEQPRPALPTPLSCFILFNSTKHLPPLTCLPPPCHPHPGVQVPGEDAFSWQLQCHVQRLAHCRCSKIPTERMEMISEMKKIRQGRSLSVEARDAGSFSAGQAEKASGERGHWSRDVRSQHVWDLGKRDLQVPWLREEGRQAADTPRCQDQVREVSGLDLSLRATCRGGD